MKNSLLHDSELLNTKIINKEDNTEFIVINDKGDFVEIESKAEQIKLTINKNELLTTYEIISW